MFLSFDQAAIPFAHHSFASPENQSNIKILAGYFFLICSQSAMLVGCGYKDLRQVQMHKRASS